MIVKPTRLAASSSCRSPVWINKGGRPDGYEVEIDKTSARSKEAEMKDRALIALMVLGLIVPAAPALAGQENTAEAMIARARVVVLTPDGSRDTILKSLIDVLDASLMILPKTNYADEFRSRIEWVRGSLKNGDLFSDKARQYLGLSYKLVAGGRLWQVPAELKSADSTKKGIERATEICGRLLDSALTERKAGNNEEAVRYLLEFVLLIVTPIQA
jgi:hypothetical protein